MTERGAEIPAPEETDHSSARRPDLHSVELLKYTRRVLLYAQKMLELPDAHSPLT